MQLDKSEIIYKRLISNNLHSYYAHEIDQFLAFTGPVQAQDSAQAFWAIASRFEALNAHDINQALEKKKIIRTWSLRGTLHMMRREDVSWLVDLVGPLYNARQKGTLTKAGFSEEDLEKSIRALRQHLVNGPISRKEIYEIHRSMGISVEGLRGGFLMYHAGMKGLICPIGHEEGMYDLQERWVGSDVERPSNGEEELARRYFQSHGPATIEDFCHWSSLTKTAAKKAIENLSNLNHYSCNGKSYFALGDLEGEFPQMPIVHLLAGFDEYILGYKDRTLVLREDIFHRVVSVNGIFRPTVLIHGEVAGIWKRSIKQDGVQVDFELFQIINAKQKDALYACAERFKQFLQVEKLEVKGL
ncbi:MAG: hypothetical protein RLZZ543_191 [Bacteroidota bacterium]|jgi:hypothetical protein